MDNQNDPDSILLFGIKRNVTNLFKDFLILVEQLKDDHGESLDKLSKFLPDSSKKDLYLSNHFTQEKMERIRKHILSKGNDCYRSIEEQLKSYDIKFK